ncbi:hypothetical protein PtB15_5B292 [Puccinia triticina]|nr:hypothetical protein PtB15_5B292 [Puccinia triticina]
MLMISKDELGALRAHRARLEKETLAVNCCLLLGRREDMLAADQQQEIIIKNGKVAGRRKKDYNEVLRLWDLVDM